MYRWLMYASHKEQQWCLCRWGKKRVVVVVVAVGGGVVGGVVVVHWKMMLCPLTVEKER